MGSKTNFSYIYKGYQIIQVYIDHQKDNVNLKHFLQKQRNNETNYAFRGQISFRFKIL